MAASGEALGTVEARGADGDGVEVLVAVQAARDSTATTDQATILLTSGWAG